MDEKLRVLLELHDKYTAEMEKAVAVTEKLEDSLSRVDSAANQAAEGLGQMSNRIAEDMDRTTAATLRLRDSFGATLKEYYALRHIQNAQAGSLRLAADAAGSFGKQLPVLQNIASTLKVIEKNTTGIISPFMRVLYILSQMGEAVEGLRTLASFLGRASRAISDFSKSTDKIGDIRRGVKSRMDAITGAFRSSRDSVKGMRDELADYSDFEKKVRARMAATEAEAAAKSKARKEAANAFDKKWQSMRVGRIKEYARKSEDAQKKVAETSKKAAAGLNQVAEAAKKAIKDVGDGGTTIHSLGPQMFAQLIPLLKKEVQAFRNTWGRLQNHLRESNSKVANTYRNSASEISKFSQRAKAGLSQVAVSVRTALGGKSAKVAQGFGKTLGSLKVRIAALTAAAFATLGVFKLLGGAFTVGQDHFKIIETAELQFRFLLGSTAKAKEEMEKLVEFAKTTPFTLPGVVKANRLLLNFGGSALATEDTLRLVGDAAAVSGQSFERVAFWIGRAYTLLQGNQPIGEATRALTEMGVISGVVQNSLNAMATSGADAEETWTKLKDAISGTEGATEALSQTLSGLESTLQDAKDTALASIFESWAPMVKWWKKIKTALWDSIHAYVEWRNQLDKGLTANIGEALFGTLEEQIERVKEKIARLKDMDVDPALGRFFDRPEQIKLLNEALEELEERLRAVKGEAEEAFERMGPGLGALDAIDAMRAKLQNLPTAKVKQDFLNLLAAWQGLSAEAKKDNLGRFVEALEEVSDAGVELGDRLQGIVDSFETPEEIAERLERIARVEESKHKALINHEKKRREMERDAQAERIQHVIETRQKWREFYRGIQKLQDEHEFRQAATGLPLPPGSHVPGGGLAGSGKGLQAGWSAEDAIPGWQEVDKKVKETDDLFKDLVSTIQLFGTTGETQTKRVVQAVASVVVGTKNIVTAWKAMAAGIKAAELASVILAVLSLILSLVNAFRGLGKTAEEIVQHAKDLGKALGDVRSGALTAAEALDRMTNWKGNEAGYDFLRSVIQDFIAIGKTAEDAEAAVAAYWDAMQRGDMAAMREAAEVLVAAAEAAREAREEAERIARQAVLQAELLGRPTAEAVENLKELVDAFFALSIEDQARAADNFADALWEAYRAGHELSDAMLAVALNSNAAKEYIQSLRDGIQEINDRIQAIHWNRALREIASQEKAVRKLLDGVRETADAQLKLLHEVHKEWISNHEERLDKIKAEGAARLSAINSEIKATKEAGDARLSALDREIQALRDSGARLPEPDLDPRLDAIGSEIESIKKAARVRLDAIGSEIESIKKAARVRLDAIGSEIESIKKAARVRLDAIGSEIESIKKAARVRLDAIGSEIESIKKAARVRLDVIDIEEKALRFQFEERRDYYISLQEEAERLHRSEMDMLSEREKKLKDMVVDPEKSWGAASSFGILRENLGQAYKDAFAAEKIQKWVDEIKELQKTGLSDEALSENEVVQSRIARIIEEIEKHGMLLPNELSNLADLLGHQGFEVGAALTRIGSEIHDIQKTREQLEIEHNSALALLNAERDQLETNHNAALALLTAERERVETELGEKLEALTAERERVETNLKLKLEALNAERERVETNHNAALALLTAERERVETNLKLKLEALNAERERVETNHNAALALLTAERERVETELGEKLEALTAERELVETNLKLKLEALAAERELVETNLKLKLEALAAERETKEAEYNRAVETVRLWRETKEAEYNEMLDRLAASREEVENARLELAEQREREELARLNLEKVLMEMELELLEDMQDVIGESGDMASLLSRINGEFRRILGDLKSYRVPDPPSRPTNDERGDPSGAGHYVGSGGLRDWGSGTPTVLHRREAVVTEASWLQAIERAASGAGRGGNGKIHVVKLEMNGLNLGRIWLRSGPKAAHLEGAGR